MTYLKGFQPTAFQSGAFQMDLVDRVTGAIIQFGGIPAPIIIVEPVIKGDLLGYKNGWKRALAETGSIVQFRCVAAEDGVKYQEITAYFGMVVLSGRLGNGIAGDPLYVDEGAHKGQYTQTKPTTSGDADTVIGYMATPTLGFIHSSINDDSTV